MKKLALMTLFAGAFAFVGCNAGNTTNEEHDHDHDHDHELHDHDMHVDTTVTDTTVVLDSIPQG